MKRQAFLSALCVCALVLAGPALAEDYNDRASTNWDDVMTWEPTGDYPHSPVDTATIDSHAVTLNLDLPTITSIDVGSAGTLYVTTAQTNTQTVTVDGILRASQNPGWEVTMTDGSEYRVKGGISVTGTINASGAIRLTQEQLDQTAYFRQNIIGTGTVTVGYDGGYWNRKHIRLYGDNSGFTGVLDIGENRDTYIYGEKALGNGTVNIRADRTLYVRKAVETSPHIHVEGVFFGQWVDPGCTVDLVGGEYRASTAVTGTVNASGDCRLTVGQQDQTAQFKTRVFGDGTMSVGVGWQGNNRVYLYADNSGYTGDWTIDYAPKGVHLYDVNALGTNTTGGTVTVNATLYINGASGCQRELTLNPGTLGVYNASGTYSGTVTLASGQQSRLLNDTVQDKTTTLTVDGKITGDGSLLIDGDGGRGYRSIVLTNGDNDYTGGTDLSGFDKTRSNQSDRLVASAEGCLGGGTVLVSRGTLETSADNALSGPPAVLVSDGGRLLLNSTESSHTVTLQSGGALEVAGGSTTLDYTPGTGNVQIYDGAILHKASIIDSGSVPTSQNQIHKNGGVGGQVYMGFNSNPAGSFTVGSSANTADLYKGLAAIHEAGVSYGGIALDSGVSITEKTVGGGFALYAANGLTLTINGPTLTCTGQLALEGDGNFSFAGGAPDLASVGGIDMNGSGEVSVPGSLSGKTLNINNGRASFESDALDATSLVNVNGPAGEFNGGGLYIDTIYTGCTGRIKVKGGGVCVGTNDQAAQVALDYVNPSYIAVRQTGTIAIPDGNSLVMQQGGAYLKVGLDDLQLPDEGVAAMVRESPSSGDYRMEWKGDITSNGDSAHIAARGSTYIYAQLHMSGDELVIGGSHTLPGVNGNMTDYDLNATVSLQNASNQIGTIDVRGGTLYVGSTSYLGGASEVNICDGATLHLGAHQSTLSNTLTGPGEVEMWQYGGAGYLTMKGARAGGVFAGDHLGTISPGNSVGIMTFSGYLKFDRTAYVSGTVTEYEYARVDIDVEGHGAVPGVDHDQVQVANMNLTNLGNADLKLYLPAPSARLNPLTLAAGVDMTIINVLTGTTSGTNVHDIDVDSRNPTVSGYWQAVNTATAVSVVDNDVILHGANIVWTGHKGDADLNNEVDVLDLAKLANNFGRDDANVNWTTADFDFSGKVDVLDLAAIANAFGWKVTGGGGGGAPVPEPGCLVMLAVGAAVLVRRRRR